ERLAEVPCGQHDVAAGVAIEREARGALGTRHPGYHPVFVTLGPAHHATRALGQLLAAGSPALHLFGRRFEALQFLLLVGPCSSLDAVGFRHGGSELGRVALTAPQPAPAHLGSTAAGCVEELAVVRHDDGGAGVTLEVV